MAQHREQSDRGHQGTIHRARACSRRSDRALFDARIIRVQEFPWPDIILTL
jgi:hypothetical protein